MVYNNHHLFVHSSAIYARLRNMAYPPLYNKLRMVSHIAWHLSQGDCNQLDVLLPLLKVFHTPGLLSPPRTHILKEGGPGFLAWDSRQQESKSDNASRDLGPELAQHHVYHILFVQASHKVNPDSVTEGGLHRARIQGIVIHWVSTTNTKE